MTSDGSEMRARTTTPASMIHSEGHHSSFSNKETSEEVLIKDLRKPEAITDLLEERTFLTDCLPVEVLQAVTHHPQPTKDLGPEGGGRMGIKDVLPELEQYQPPLLSERKRDVSFLTDIQPLPQIQEKPSNLDPSAIRFHYQQGLKPPKEEIVIPETMIPIEYHVKKNKAVMGLEYDGSEPKTMKEREDGLIIFPSMKPSKREEVVFLRTTMETMLKKAQIKKDIDVSGTSQMKKMLENVKKEQGIFDCIFNELIRQTTVDSPDRAEILKLLRHRYNQLVDKVPIEVRSLHDEVLAQRALDRNLTEELMRFKTTIGVLTGELADIRQHDQRVSKQAQSADDELKNALYDSKRNAELLEEYHSLYELQRARLEQSVSQNSEEKEIWSAAAYCLALKVTEEGRLNTAKRLHVAAKAWTQLASHFTLMLSDLDTEMLTEMHGLVGKWRDVMEKISSDLISREKRSRETLGTLRAKMDGFRTVFEQKYVVNGRVVAIPDPDKRSNILQYVTEWQEILMEEIEQFRTADVNGIFDRLVLSEDYSDSWVTQATSVFKRHNLPDGHPHWTMLKAMSERVSLLSSTVRSRLSGDNGTAELAGRVLGQVAEWLVRCSPLLEVEDNVEDEEWLALDDVINGGVEDLDHLLTVIEEGQSAVNPEVLQKSHTWMTELAAAVDQMDVDLMETVGQLHRTMVDWMVRTLLLLAPPRRDGQPAALPSEEEVRQEAEQLFEKVDRFSTHVTMCCWDIVEKIEMKKFEVTMEAIGSDGLDLENIKRESDEWILSAKLLLRELYGGEIKLDKRSPEGLDETMRSEGNVSEKIKEPDAVDVTIPPATPVDDEMENSGADEEHQGDEEIDTQMSYEAMAAMASLKIQYKGAMERTNQATLSCSEAQTELEKAQDDLYALEKEVSAAAAHLADLKGRPEPEEKRPALLREGSSPRPRAALQTDAAVAARRQQTQTSADNIVPAPGLAPAPAVSRSTTRGSSVKKSEKKTTGARHRKK